MELPAILHLLCQSIRVGVLRLSARLHDRGSSWMKLNLYQELSLAFSARQ